MQLTENIKQMNRLGEEILSLQKKNIGNKSLQEKIENY